LRDRLRLNGANLNTQAGINLLRRFQSWQWFRRKTNLPWWQRLDRAAAAHKIRWEWTRGHAGHLLQEAADNAARRIAAAGQVDESILRDAVDKIGTEEL